MITFAHLRHEDLGLMTAWLNKPHVNQWYGQGKSWNDTMVHNKYSPRINAEEEVYAFIVLHKSQPIGYIQWYPLSASLPTGMTDEHEIFHTHARAHCAGLDCFIGEENELGKGHGTKMVTQFCDDYLFPTYPCIIADPALDNIRAIRLFYRCGFLYHDGKKDGNHCLMIKQCQ